MTTLHLRLVDSPLGTLRLVAADDALVAVYLPADGKATPDLPAAAAHPILDLAAREIAEYFAAASSRRRFFTPLRAKGTDFQRAVWQQLLAIPFGETRSYAQVAAALGRPEAVRAVGAANGQNPLPLFIPCHRVIGKNGKLTGFGGGLPAKRWLLDHEAGPARRGPDILESEHP